MDGRDDGAQGGRQGVSSVKARVVVIGVAVVLLLVGIGFGVLSASVAGGKDRRASTATTQTVFPVFRSDDPAVPGDK